MIHELKYGLDIIEHAANDGAETKDNWVYLVIQKPFEVDHVLRLVQEGMLVREQHERGKDENISCR
jgi:hypothetical protein